MATGDDAFDVIVSAITIGVIALVTIPVFQILLQQLPTSGPFSDTLFLLKFVPLFIGLLAAILLLGGLFRAFDEISV